MSDSQTVKTHQEAFLARAKARIQPVVYTVADVDIVVNPGVFPQATDTRLLASNIKVKPQDMIIDMTTGSGGIAVIAGLQKAQGYAVDINPQAVANAKENIAKNKVNITALESDLFAKVPPVKFDWIFANGPFMEGEIVDPMDHACYGAKMFIENLLAHVKDRLAENGKLLIVVTTWIDLEHFAKTVEDNGLNAVQTDTRFSDDHQRQYVLYQVTRK